MRWRHLLSAVVTLVSTACSTDTIPTSPAGAASVVGRSALSTSAPATSDENGVVSPLLADMNAQLAAAGANVRIAKAELLLDGHGWNARSSTIIFANDRARGFGAEWVNGDPRRDGHVGLTYAIGSDRPSRPFVRNPDNSGVRQLTFAEIDAQIEEGVSAWRGQQCSNSPLTRVEIAAGTDPDYLDEYFRGLPVSTNYVQPSDIVEAGWQPLSFFRSIAGPDGDFILGVTFTFIFVDANGPTDIDRNGKDDIGLAEIFYNAGYFWGTSGAPNVIDFYSIITHETGHALGLGHFGKIFVTKKAAADGLSLADVKFAPRAMMNAVYFTGRNEIEGTDNSSFCQLWASK